MANPFETGARKNIPAVLVYAREGAPGVERFLMIHRDASGRGGRLGDYHAGKWNGLGGKIEADESALAAATREFREESGLALEPSRFRPLGVLQFPNFKAHKSEDWTVFVFTAVLAEEEAARVLPRMEEGSLHWVPSADLLKLNLWPGDRHFLPFVVEGRAFLGTFWYEGEQLARYELDSIARNGKL